MSEPAPFVERDAVNALPLLVAIGVKARDELLAIAERRTYAPGQLLLAELEPGDELLIVLTGRAAVTVGSAELHGEERLGEIGPGESVGEIAFLTGSLRSASVRALEPVTALVLQREQLQGLMVRYPSIAARFLALMASRLAAADRVLAEALAPVKASAAAHGKLLGGLDRQSREIAVHRRSLRQLLSRAFQELVVEHRRELPFYLLGGFLVSFGLARLVVFGLQAAGLGLESALRGAYVGGVALLLLSAGLNPFVYRRPLRRALCLTFGVACGLIVNELSVWLSFDVFYRDIFTRDPSVRFDLGALYQRSATLWVFTLIVVLLVQATYLARFYRRAYYLLRERWSARK